MSRVRRLTAIGLCAGMLAGAIETARLVWLTPGIYVPWRLAPYAAAIDGLAGAILALAGALLLTLVGAVRSRGRGVDVTRSQGVISRRALLGLTAGSAAAVALVALGAGLQRRGITGQTAGGPSSSGTTAGKPPNIVLVTIDTIRADQLGAYGNSIVRTPTLDGLAAQGARFAWHFIQEPQTNPSHASMFVGQYPTTSGVRVHMVDKVPSGLATLSGVLEGGGYQTAGLYSWMSFDNQYSGLQRGFQTYRNVAPAQTGAMANPMVKRAMAEYRIAEQYLLLPQAANEVVPLKSNVETLAKGDARLTTDAAIQQLHAFDSRSPFFLWVHYFDPHYPYEPPPQFDSLYSPGYGGSVDGSMKTIDAIQNGELQLSSADLQRLQGLYQAEITYLDGQLARLVAEVQSLDAPGGTALAVTGDHGESFGAHPDLTEGVDFFHPHTLYNAEQHVPMILHFPGRIRPGVTIPAPTQAIDLFPTLLELGGIAIPSQAQGRTLLGLLDGRDDGSSRVAYGAMPDSVFTSVISGGWKLILNTASGTERLFNLIADPAEQTDQLRSRPDIASELRSKLLAWMKEANAR